MLLPLRPHLAHCPIHLILALPLPHALQAPDGSLQRVSGSRRLDLPLDAALDSLARFRQGVLLGRACAA